MEDDPNFVDLMRRWENAGGVWRVLGQDHRAVTVALYRCDGGEEADRFVSLIRRSHSSWRAARAARSAYRRPAWPPDTPTMMSAANVIETHRDAHGRHVRGIGLVGRCLTATRASSQCRRNRYHRWRQFRTLTS